MALTAELEELVGKLPEADRKAVREQLEKHETLRAGFLRQADYDRKMNEAKPKIEKADEWIKWADKNVPLHKQAMDELAEARKKNEELENQVKEAAQRANANPTNGDGNVDQNVLMSKVEERLKALPFASKDDVAKVVAEETKKLGDRFFAETFPNAVNWLTSTMDLEFSHRQEFNEPLPRVKLSEFMKEKKVTDPKQAYEMMVGETRKEREITKRVDEEVKKRLSTANVPGTSGGTAPTLGPVETRLKNQDPLGDQVVRFGDGQASNAAAAELRSEGKF